MTRASSAWSARIGSKQQNGAGRDSAINVRALAALSVRTGEYVLYGRQDSGRHKMRALQDNWYPVPVDVGRSAERRARKQWWACRRRE